MKILANTMTRVVVDFGQLAGNSMASLIFRPPAFSEDGPHWGNEYGDLKNAATHLTGTQYYIDYAFPYIGVWEVRSLDPWNGYYGPWKEFQVVAS